MLQKKSIPDSVRMGTEVKLRQESNAVALGVVEVDSPGGHHLQSGEGGQVGEEQRDHGEQRVLVEKVEDQRLQAHLVGLSVHEEELAHAAEGGEAHVAVVVGLESLLALDADADVALADHSDVVRPVAHAQHVDGLVALWERGGRGVLVFRTPSAGG